MADLIQVSKPPQCNQVVRTGEKFGEITFTPEEIKKTVQAGAYLWFNNEVIKLPG